MPKSGTYFAQISFVQFVTKKLGQTKTDFLLKKRLLVFLVFVVVFQTK